MKISECKYCGYIIEADPLHGWVVRQWNGSELVYCFKNNDGNKRHHPKEN